MRINDDYKYLGTVAFRKMLLCHFCLFPRPSFFVLHFTCSDKCSITHAGQCVACSAGCVDLMNIIPMREMVAGEAQERSWDSNRKLTFGPNWILSPEGMVRSRLSSSTELRDSIHSGSMSPSQTIQEWTEDSSFTTPLAENVRTPSVHSLVSMSM